MTAPTHHPSAPQTDAFRIPPDVHYLNCAYMAPLPRVVEEAVVEGLRQKRLPTDLHPSDFFTESDEVRSLFARLIGASDPARVALHPSVSYGVATAARNLSLHRSQAVVLLGEQFPGNVYAWHRLAAAAGAEVRTVDRPRSDRPGAAWNAALLDALADDVAIAALPTVHWTDGTRFDLEAVGKRCREIGAALVVDGTQSVGAVPFDVERVRPDALIVAGYKWLLGPYSLALTWLGSRFDDGTPLEETWIGRAGSEDFQGLVDYVEAYQPGAARFDVGERSNFTLLPGLRAALELVLAWTPEAIASHGSHLAAPLLEAARELGFGVEADGWRSPHLFGLRMPAGVDLRDLAARLRNRRVYASLRGSSLRVSPHLYNGPADIDALLAVLRSA